MQRLSRARRLSDPEYKEKLKQKRKTYRESNIEVLRAKNRQWGQENKQHTSKYKKKYLEKNKDRLQNYRQSSEFKALKAKRRKFNWPCYMLKSILRRKHECSIDVEWIINQFEKQNQKCFYSGLTMIPSLQKMSLAQPSIDRVDSSKGYHPDNVVLCCWAMNMAKGVSSVGEFQAFLRQLKAVQ